MSVLWFLQAMESSEEAQRQWREPAKITHKTLAQMKAVLREAKVEQAEIAEFDRVYADNQLQRLSFAKAAKLHQKAMYSMT